MAKITYRGHDGTTTVIDAESPNTVMRVAKLHNIDGIEAQCGGSAQCGTCHVYVDESCGVTLPPIHEAEDDVLYGTASPRHDNSRLSCQLQVTDAIDGLVVQLPETQS